MKLVTKAVPQSHIKRCYADLCGLAKAWATNRGHTLEPMTTSKVAGGGLHGSAVCTRCAMDAQVDVDFRDDTAIGAIHGSAVSERCNGGGEG